MTTLIDLRITGGSWAKHVLIHAAGVYFSKKLKGFRGKRVRVSVDLAQGLKRKEHCRGMAHQNSKRGYLIKLDAGLKPLALVRCLAHEMIHVNQWLTGKMEDLNHRYQVRWGSRFYHPGDLRYNKHPWEIEAYRYDKGLAQNFINFWKTK